MPWDYQHPYPGGQLVKVDGFPRDVKVGSIDGDDVQAYKRCVSRAGRWEWANFDDTFSKGFSLGIGGNVIDTGVAGVQRQQNMAADGVVDEEMFNLFRSIRIPVGLPHAGEPAMDATAVNLINAAFRRFHKPPDPTPAIRVAMADYMRRGIANNWNWHYIQQRPMTSLGKNPDGTINADCSEGATAVYFWGKKVTGYGVPDPNGMNYDGYGNTDSLWAHNSAWRASPPYQIGDLALYTGNGGHVTVCMVYGDANSARWWSNGTEGGPLSVNLHYRHDLRGVVRPRLL